MAVYWVDHATTYSSMNKLLRPFLRDEKCLYESRMKTTSVRWANSGQLVSYKHPLTNSFITFVLFVVVFFFSTFQPCIVPKKMERHDEINLGKVNKILVDTNIDPKKVWQWNIVAKNTIILRMSWNKYWS